MPLTAGGKIYSEGSYDGAVEDVEASKVGCVESTNPPNLTKGDFGM